MDALLADMKELGVSIDPPSTSRGGVFCVAYTLSYRCNYPLDTVDASTALRNSCIKGYLSTLVGGWLSRS